MIVLDYRDKRPLNEQVAEKIMNLIAQGGLVPGERLPSVRNLAMDLNTANAVSLLYDVLKANTNDRTKLYLIKDFERVLSLGLLDRADKYLQAKAEKEANRYAGVPEEVVKLVEERAQAKKAKDFARADALRDQISALGYTVKDTAEGPVIEKA